LTSDPKNEIELVESDPKNIVIGPYMTLNMARLLYAKKNLHIGQESLGRELIAVMTRKRSPLTRPFDWV